MRFFFLIILVLVGCIFLYKSQGSFLKNSWSSVDVSGYLTKKEQERLPLLIAVSLKQIGPDKIHFGSFIEGINIAEKEKINGYQQGPEIRAYSEYVLQVALDPKITENINASTKYLQEKQNTEGAISLVKDKICYKIIKDGIAKGVENNLTNDLKINFTIKDAVNNVLAGNYALSGPLSCTLSELIPGMAYGMLGMRLKEVREIYVHPEFAYGVFSNFASGKILSIQVELVECSAAGESFSPCLIPVDLAKSLKKQPTDFNMISLQKDYICFLGKASWAFYRQQLPQLPLDDILTLLQSEDATSSLSPEDRETLHKLQWLIYKNENTREDRAP